MSDARARELAHLAAGLLAVDPGRLGGVHLRAGPGPGLEAWTAGLRAALGDRPVRRIPPHVDLGRLTGDLDLASSLRQGRRVVLRGLLADADGGVLIVPMAERLERDVAGVLAETLDTGRVVPRLPGIPPESTRVAVALLDESRDDEPGVPELVGARCALFAALPPRSAREPEPAPPAPDRMARARELLPHVEVDPEAYRTLVVLAASTGIASLRAPVQALSVARAHAAWRAAEAPDSGRGAAAPGSGRGGAASTRPPAVNDDDLAVAAALSILPRAVVAPPSERDAQDEAPPPPPEPPESSDAEDDGDDARIGPLEERVIEAAEAWLPDDFVTAFSAARARGTGRRGEKLRQPLHGHRVGARPGDPRRGGRIDLPATLRTAAPWQRLRRVENERRDRAPRRIDVRREDLRLQVRVRRAATATVFVVDASGSQALNRLAEVKGAVELFLAESYVRRDQVALVTFGGRGAEVVVPPTRSLVRARALLQGLPGGGGTPLAAGLEAGFRVALRLEATEAAPRIVLLTDGRPNLRLDGGPGRSGAREDALTVARGIGASGIPTLVLDSSARGEPFAAELAAALRGSAAHLPRPDARGLTRAVGLLDTLD